MQNLLAYTLRENSTFGSNYFAGGLPTQLKLSRVESPNKTNFGITYYLPL